MKACFEGLLPLSLLRPQATQPLKGHLSISVYTKGLINGPANPALNAERHQSNYPEKSTQTLASCPPPLHASE